MPQSVTIRSLPRAFELVKGMQGQGLEWSESYRGLGRRAIAEILAGQMQASIDDHLDRMAALDQADRRNGSYRRHLLTELGTIELAVPRTRRFAPIGVVRAYARRVEQVDRMILACCLPRDSRPALLGAQDAQCAGQGAPRRSARRQSRSAGCDECQDPASGPLRGTPFRRPLGRRTIPKRSPACATISTSS